MPTTDQVREGLIGYMLDIAADRDENDQIKPDARKRLEQASAVLNSPNALDKLAKSFGTGAKPALNKSARFEESKHPRGQPDNAGQFGAGGGDSGSSKQSGSSKHEEDKPESIGRQASSAKPTHFESPVHSDTVKKHLAGESSHELHSGRAAGSGSEDTFLGDLLKESGRANKPQLVDANGMEEARKAGWWIAYRGVAHPDHAEAFRSGDLYNGAGIFGNGTYTAYAGLRRGDGKARAFAAGYAQDGGAVVAMAIPPDARIVSVSSLKAERQADLKKIDQGLSDGKISRDEHAKMEAIFSDLGRYAAIKSYDGIKDKASGFLVVLNRSICRVQKDNV